MPSSIDRVFERRVSALVNSGDPRVLQGGRKGVEKESLRVVPGGTLAYSQHPRALGSALTNEHITTDFSEALIELVTPAFTQSYQMAPAMTLAPSGWGQALPSEVAETAPSMPSETRSEQQPSTWIRATGLPLAPSRGDACRWADP